MRIVVFEDEIVSRLFPITVSRPAYAIGCASFRLIDWLSQLSHDSDAELHGVVRPHLTDIQRLDFPQLSRRVFAAQTPALLVNARLVPAVSAFRGLETLIKQGQTAAVYENGSLAAALIAADGPAPPPNTEIEHWNKYVANSLLHKLPPADLQLPLFAYPHDVVRENLTIIGASLEYRLKTGEYKEVADGVFEAGLIGGVVGHAAAQVRGEQARDGDPRPREVRARGEDPSPVLSPPACPARLFVKHSAHDDSSTCSLAGRRPVSGRRGFRGPGISTRRTERRSPTRDGGLASRGGCGAPGRSPSLRY